MENPDFKLLTKLKESNEKALKELFFNYHDTLFRFICYRVTDPDLAEDIAQGETFNASNIRIIRPAFGLAPKHWGKVLGKQASVALKKGTALDWKHIG